MVEEDSDDFQDVSHAGGVVTFHVKVVEGQPRLTIGFRHGEMSGCSVLTVNALLAQGLAIGPSVEDASRSSQPPPGCVPVLIVSDEENYFGAACPSCTRYFRTNGSQAVFTCPYCATRTVRHAFLTTAQQTYVAAYCRLCVEALTERTSRTVDLDGLAVQVGSSVVPASFAEQRQQTRFTCKCGVGTDVTGRFGNCPCCGRRNSLDIFEQELAAAELRVSQPQYEDRQRREAEWRNLVRDCVSTFEGFARDLLGQLMQFPATPTRRRDQSQITFHNPIKAAAELRRLWGIDLLQGLSRDDQDFIERRFLRRHVYEHRSGVADSEYVRDSGENVQVGELLRERSNNVKQLIAHLKVLAAKFDAGFHAIE